jgi:diphthine synthase
MFYLIGIGLNPKHITFEAIEAINKCDSIYIDNYTNIFSQGNINDLEKIINKKIIPLNRIQLEQKMDFLKNKSCLLVIGNIFSATTHYTVYREAKKRNIPIKIIPGISIFNFKGISSLSEYKFGKVVSIVYPEKNYFPTSFFNTIKQNINIGAHTMCLMDIKTTEERFMSIKEACEILNSIDKNNILDNKICVALCAMGSENQEIKVFKFKEYNKLDLKQFPQTLLISGKLNDYEKEGLDEYSDQRI